MNELQLKLCDIQGRLFELSGIKGYDSIPFIKTFMNSHVAQGLDSKYNRFQWAGEEYLLAEVEDIAPLPKSGKIFDKEILYWSGYLYRFWHYSTGENSKEIYRQVPAKTMNMVYLIYHTMSPEMAIDRLKEAYNETKE